MLDQSLGVLLLHDWHDLTVQRYVLSIVTPPLVELRELLSLFNVYRESLNESLAPKLLSKDTELSVDIFKCYLKTYFFRSLLTARRSSALKTPWLRYINRRLRLRLRFVNNVIGCKVTQRWSAPIRPTGWCYLMSVGSILSRMPLDR